MALLDVKNLCVDFHTDQGTVHAVRDISFSVGESEAVGIVGESGSGKSVTMYSVMGLLAGNGSHHWRQRFLKWTGDHRKRLPGP